LIPALRRPQTTRAPLVPPLPRSGPPRIVGLADVIDALLSKRSYKSGWSPRQVKTFLREQAGTAFDPRLAGLAVEAFEDLLAIRQSAAQPVRGYVPLPAQVPFSSRTISVRNDTP